MQYFKAILLVSILTFSNAAFALSDAYYSQGLYMDFEIAEDDDSVERDLKVIFAKLVNLVSDDKEGHFSIDFSYLLKNDE